MNNDFHISFTFRFRRKFSIDLLYRLPPHLRCVTTLPCEIWKSNIVCNKILSTEYLFIIYIFFANNNVTRYLIVFVNYCINCLFQHRISRRNKNSSGDEIANVNFLRRYRTCREDSAYAHWTYFLISTIIIYAIGLIYAHNQSSMHLRQ